MDRDPCLLPKKLKARSTGISAFKMKQNQLIAAPEDQAHILADQFSPNLLSEANNAIFFNFVQTLAITALPKKRCRKPDKPRRTKCHH